MALGKSPFGTTRLWSVLFHACSYWGIRKWIMCPDADVWSIFKHIMGEDSVAVSELHFMSGRSRIVQRKSRSLFNNSSASLWASWLVILIFISWLLLSVWFGNFGWRSRGSNILRLPVVSSPLTKDLHPEGATFVLRLKLTHPWHPHTALYSISICDLQPTRWSMGLSSLSVRLSVKVFLQKHLQRARRLSALLSDASDTERGGEFP